MAARYKLNSTTKVYEFESHTQDRDKKYSDEYGRYCSFYESYTFDSTELDSVERLTYQMKLSISKHEHMSIGSIKNFILTNYRLLTKNTENHRLLLEIKRYLDGNHSSSMLNIVLDSRANIDVDKSNAMDYALEDILPTMFSNEFKHSEGTNTPSYRTQLEFIKALHCAQRHADAIQ